MKKILFSLLLVHVFTLSFGQTFLINEDFQMGIPGTWQNITDDTSTVHPDVDEFTDAWIIKKIQTQQEIVLLLQLLILNTEVFLPDG